jgi:glycerol-3-phosphate dehydrogenase
MGEDMVNRIEQKLNWHYKKSITENLPIHGAALTRDWNDSMYVYGSDTNQLHIWMHKFGNSIISESLGIYEVQIIWALHHEMARTLEDILARRTRALFLDANESILIARPVATIMAREMEKDEDWINTQVDAYVQLASKYIL